MKPRQAMPREQILFMIVLILLAAVAVVSWFQDPAHQPSGESRVGWPSSPAKP